MKSAIFVLFGLVLMSGAVMACACSENSDSGAPESYGLEGVGESGAILDVGESKGAGELANGNGHDNAGNSNGSRNDTDSSEGEEDDDVNGTGQEVRQQTQQENQGESQGISEQVRQVVEERKNGSITVPQGMVVRIVAQNHLMSVENASFQLQEQLTANVMVHGQNKSFQFGPAGDEVEMTDGNVSVTTNETIEVANDSLYVAGQKVMLMPSAVPGKIKAKTVKSMVLHLTEGDLAYEVNATKAMKLFWLFDADMDVEATVDAETGEVKGQKGPWWAFLASEAG